MTKEMTNKQETLEKFEQLLVVLSELREKCPWDKAQTIDTLRLLTIEETYELSESILNHDVDEIKKELGDLLLHIVFYAKIAEEKSWFAIADVMESLIEKLKHRHPHIYGNTQANSAKEVEENWEQIKLKEKDRKKQVLSGVPTSLPPVIKAFRIQQKARGVGFDWEYKEQVWDKVTEELNELKDEIAGYEDDSNRMEQEFGDLLFSMINAGRLYNIDPEKALEMTNKKFISRFNYLESQTIAKGNSLHDMSLDEMEVIWQEAKKYDNKNK